MAQAAAARITISSAWASRASRKWVRCQ